MIELKVKKLHPDAIIPTYATDGSACFDLHSVEAGIVEARGGYRVFRTGLAFEVENGWRSDIHSRSGMGFNHGVRLANSTGKIDQDYRGEVLVCLHNDRKSDLVIRKGDRIAQAEINRVYRAALIEVDELGTTVRGAGGFGSTGL